MGPVRAISRSGHRPRGNPPAIRHRETVNWTHRGSRDWLHHQRTCTGILPVKLAAAGCTATDMCYVMGNWHARAGPVATVQAARAGSMPFAWGGSQGRAAHAGKLRATGDPRTGNSASAAPSPRMPGHHQHEQRSPPMKLTRRSWLRTAAALPLAARSRTTARARRRADQGRHPAFAVRHDGDQRDHPERPDADGDRRPERPRRAAGPADPAGGGRSGIELAVVRGEGARIADRGQGRRGVRLLDLGVAQVRAAGVRGTERPAVLSAGIRGRRTIQRMCSMAVRCRTTKRSRR